jgi:hypothetical protein
MLHPHDLKGAPPSPQHWQAVQPPPAPAALVAAGLAGCGPPPLLRRSALALHHSPTQSDRSIEPSHLARSAVRAARGELGFRCGSGRGDPGAETSAERPRGPEGARSPGARERAGLTAVWFEAVVDSISFPTICRPPAPYRGPLLEPARDSFHPARTVTRIGRSETVFEIARVKGWS